MMFRQWSGVGKVVLCPVHYGAYRPDLSRSLQAMTSLSTRRKIGPSGYLLLIIPGAAFCLGSWQVQRRQWKLNLINELQEKVGHPPIPLPERLEKTKDMEYQRVSIKGTFQHKDEMLYGPRPPLFNGRYKETGSMVSSGSSGFLVITPFTLEDTGVTILVNRGWVPKNKRTSANRLGGQVEGVQELTGIIRKEEARPPFMPKKHDNSIFFLYRDINTMSRSVNCAPVFVDACDGVPEGPLAGQTRITLRNEHFSYLLTWYSLSAVTGFLWYRRYINFRAML